MTHTYDRQSGEEAPTSSPADGGRLRWGGSFQPRAYNIADRGDPHPDLPPQSRGKGQEIGVPANPNSCAEECVYPPEPMAVHNDDKVTEALNELYSEEPSRLDEVVAQMQWLSLPREDW